MLGTILRRTTAGAGALAVAATVACVIPAGAGAVSNGDPCSPFWTQASAPVAAFNPPSTQTLTAATFDASSSSPGTAHKWTWVSGDAKCEATSVETDPISSYKWDFGDGSSETDAAASTSHSYSHSGVYTVTLTVGESNCQGGTSAHCFTKSVSHSVTILDRPPTAQFTAPAAATTGQSVTLDAAGSSDADGSVTAYHWEFGDGQTLDSATPSAVHSYATAGVKAITLTVTDDSGSTSQTVIRTITVADRPPVAAFAAPGTIAAGQTASFDASASSDPDGTVVSYHWEFGDGSAADTSTPKATHVFSGPGSETVTLTVTDNSGSTDQAQHTVTVTVTPPPPPPPARACVVPSLAGRHLASARAALARSDCRLGKVSRRHSRRRNRGKVIGQSAKPGTHLPGGAGVAVTVGK